MIYYLFIILIANFSLDSQEVELQRVKAYFSKRKIPWFVISNYLASSPEEWKSRIPENVAEEGTKEGKEVEGGVGNLDWCHVVVVDLRVRGAAEGVESEERVVAEGTSRETL